MDYLLWFTIALVIVSFAWLQIPKSDVTEFQKPLTPEPETPKPSRISKRTEDVNKE